METNPRRTSTLFGTTGAFPEAFEAPRALLTLSMPASPAVQASHWVPGLKLHTPAVLTPTPEHHLVSVISIVAAPLHRFPSRGKPAMISLVPLSPYLGLVFLVSVGSATLWSEEVYSSDSVVRSFGSPPEHIPAAPLGCLLTVVLARVLAC